MMIIVQINFLLDSDVEPWWISGFTNEHSWQHAFDRCVNKFMCWTIYKNRRQSVQNTCDLNVLHGAPSLDF